MVFKYKGLSSIVVFPPEGSVSFLASVQAHTNRPFWAILEYTKTTDQGVTP